MELSTDLIFKKKNKKDYIFLDLSKEKDDPDTICISAGNRDALEIYLYFDIESLKELSLLINEFLVKGEDISIPHRIGDFGIKGAKVGMKSVSIDMVHDKISVYFDDSLDAEDQSPIFIIENKKGETVTLCATVDQCAKISKAMRRYVFAHRLMNQAHEGNTVKAKSV